MGNRRGSSRCVEGRLEYYGTFADLGEAARVAAAVRAARDARKVTGPAVMPANTQRREPQPDIWSAIARG